MLVFSIQHIFEIKPMHYDASHLGCIYVMTLSNNMYHVFLIAVHIYFMQMKCA